MKKWKQTQCNSFVRSACSPPAQLVSVKVQSLFGDKGLKLLFRLTQHLSGEPGFSIKREVDLSVVLKCGELASYFEAHAQGGWRRI